MKEPLWKQISNLNQGGRVGYNIYLVDHAGGGDPGSDPPPYKLICPHVALPLLVPIPSAYRHSRVKIDIKLHRSNKCGPSVAHLCGAWGGIAWGGGAWGGGEWGGSTWGGGACGGGDIFEKTNAKHNMRRSTEMLNTPRKNTNLCQQGLSYIGPNFEISCHNKLS